MAQNTRKSFVGYLDLRAQAEPPVDPEAYHAIIWLSDGTEAANNAGDLIAKVTDALGNVYQTKLYARP